MLLQLSQFYAFVPQHPSSYLRQSLHRFHVHGSCICVLWLLYSLCCTLHPHDYSATSVTTSLYFLIPLPCPPIPLTPSHLATIKMFSIPMILFLLCLLVYYTQLLICICCHFIVCIFDLLLKEDPLTFYIMLVWWRCTPLAFSCLGSSLSVLQF